MRFARRTTQLVVLLCVLVACGGQSKRVETLKATLTAVNQARDSFLAFDAKAQILIADTAPMDRVVELLAAYRKRAALIVDTFVLTYQAIATAATLDDDDASIASMVLAVKNLGERIKALQKDYAP